MSAASSAGLLAVGATWQLTGLAAAGNALVRAATTGGDTERTLAGMLLVRAGDRSVPLLTEAVRAGPAAVDLVDVLASIGTDEARAALVGIARASPPAVATDTAEAAGAALRTLDEVRRRDP